MNFGTRMLPNGKHGRCLLNFKGVRVLVTGHTGFKGSWLNLCLNSLGATVYGFSLPDKDRQLHFSLLDLDQNSKFGDIRNLEEIEKVVSEFNPELIFHLAAQSIVGVSYKDPLTTFSTNILGTANLLDTIRRSKSVKAVVIATSDKCYLNDGRKEGYKENDRIGGQDPYSASKACAEIVSTSFVNSFRELGDERYIATVRSGNVIGGGDWSNSRLIPDIMNWIFKNEPFLIRMPEAVRPWQHVLNVIEGYLMLAEKLLAGEQEFCGAWNFGPFKEENLTVAQIISIFKSLTSKEIEANVSSETFKESSYLSLDSTKSNTKLNWIPRWTQEISLQKTYEWYRSYYETGQIISREQLSEFFSSQVLNG